MIYKEKDFECEIWIGKTSQPVGQVYEESAWWATTQGRQPDIELAGPFRTKRELLAQLNLYRKERYFSG